MYELVLSREARNMMFTVLLGSQSNVAACLMAYLIPQTA